MKAITLWQPWASLIAYGAKHNETRSWPIKYRGPIAIHAAARPCIHLADIDPEADNAACLVFEKEFYESSLPRGCVVATANLVECWKVVKHTQTAIILKQSNGVGEDKLPIDAPYLVFGDYSVGRYIWGFADVCMLPEPIPTRGMQGLWNWEKNAYYSKCVYWGADGKCTGFNCCREAACPNAKEYQPWLF